MRKNVKRTIAVLSAVCMLPCPQVANVAVMAQNVSVGSSIGAKTLKQSLQTSTNFETASGKRREVKENNIEDSYDITYGDSITFFVSKTKIPDQDQTDNSGNEDDQKQDDGQKDSETDVIPDYEVPDTINGFSFNKEETDDGYQLTFTANEAMRSAAIKIKGQDVVLKTKKRKLTAKASVKIIDSYRCERMLYISCKPTSLARDLEILADAGYKVIKATAVDQFPNTVHIETICLLELQ